jgi:hypothetical protein
MIRNDLSSLSVQCERRMQCVFGGLANKDERGIRNHSPKAFSVAWHGVKFWSGVAEHWRGGLSFRSGQSDDMSQLSRMGCRASFGDRLEIGVAV